MSSKTSPRRRAARFAIAGALVAVPLAAVAATASAEAPDQSVPVVQAAQDAPQQAGDINNWWHHRRHHHHHDHQWQLPGLPLPGTGSAG
ncbi:MULTISPECIES: hypothetical protein [unclassified Nocardia]|uniref:hypothetical protein n=1 Tax=unclassified Nocardia TaxID=2637762 RepID=UPI001CE411E8|nr:MULTISPECIES: hypothetical protein [unclassified Nocardia]